MWELILFTGRILQFLQDELVVKEIYIGMSWVQFAWCLAQGGITLAYFTDPALEYFQIL